MYPKETSLKPDKKSQTKKVFMGLGKRKIPHHPLYRPLSRAILEGTYVTKNHELRNIPFLPPIS
jgi:hypothetical protein